MTLWRADFAARSSAVPVADNAAKTEIHRFRRLKEIQNQVDLVPIAIHLDVKDVEMLSPSFGIESVIICEICGHSWKFVFSLGA